MFKVGDKVECISGGWTGHRGRVTAIGNVILKWHNEVTNNESGNFIKNFKKVENNSSKHPLTTIFK